MIAKQTKGKDIPGRGTHVDKGLEVGTRCYTGIRGGWSVELGEMCQAGRLGQDVKASCISPRRLDSIVKTVGSQGHGQCSQPWHYPHLGPDHSGGAALHIPGCLAASLSSTHEMPAAPPPPPYNYDTLKCLQTLPKVSQGMGGKIAP